MNLLNNDILNTIACFGILAALCKAVRLLPRVIKIIF